MPLFFFFQAEDGIRDLVRSRGLGDVYKRQLRAFPPLSLRCAARAGGRRPRCGAALARRPTPGACLLYTSDAADERSSVDLGGRRIIKKKTLQKEQLLGGKSQNTIRRVHMITQ